MILRRNKCLKSFSKIVFASLYSTTVTPSPSHSFMNAKCGLDNFHPLMRFCREWERMVVEKCYTAKEIGWLRAII
jgi:hypothetical protein